MKHLIKIIFSSILIFDYSYAFVYRLEIWTNGKQNLHFLCDYHLPKKEENMIADLQQNEFIKIVQQCKGFVIVEDVNSLYPKKSPIPIDKRTFLAFLAHRCSEANIPVVNVEFRTPSISPRIAKPVCGAAKIQLELANQVKKEILTFNDGTILNNYYRTILNDLKEKVEIPCNPLFRKIMEESNKTCLELVPLLTPLFDNNCAQALIYLQKGMREESLLKTFDMELKILILLVSYFAPFLDCRILHVIANNKNPNIFICAGAVHIDAIKPVLEQLDFKRTKMIGNLSKIEPTGFIEQPAISIKNNLTCTSK